MASKSRAAGFRSILCPIDFSSDSSRALEAADLLARRWRSRLTVLYAIDPMLASAAAAALNEPSLPERSDEEMRVFVRATLGAKRTADGGIKYITRVGHAAAEILHVVKAAKADLIVMGTHGLTGPRKFILGSATQGVLHRTTVPVLAMPNAPSGALPIGKDWPGQRVIAAIDLDAGAPEAARNAARIAGWFGSALVLAHVVRDVPVPPWMHAALTAHDRIRLDKARAALEALADRLKASYTRIDCRVLCGNPADEIAALVASERAGLVITTLSKTGSWFSPARGSISYHVLSHATAPVLALPR